MPVTREQWEDRLRLANELMQKREGESSLLIEVAAQHPLIDGVKPNKEFEERLVKGKELYQQAKTDGREVEIYVPGSRHRHEGVADQISLSQAGFQFLVDQGLPARALHGEDLNQKYKSTQGVYNSADECFVAASYFKDGQFGTLYSVLSPVQLQRKALHYIWFGVLPMFYTAPTQHTFHNYLREVYDLVPYVRDVDPGMQDQDSYYGRLWRKERRP